MVYDMMNRLGRLQRDLKQQCKNSREVMDYL